MWHNAQSNHARKGRRRGSIGAHNKMTTIEGNLIGTGLRFAIVQARFNTFIGQHLSDGAIGTLRQHGVSPENIDLVYVPGSWELPLAVQRVARTQRYDGIVALGVLIRGETAHFEYIAGEATRGLGAIARESGVPVGFGVLTVESTEQAVERAGNKMGNKGADAALAALEMATLLRAIDQRGAF
jgi:6,7-dimethyl-8-ribityllumazine synthase